MCAPLPAVGVLAASMATRALTSPWTTREPRGLSSESPAKAREPRGLNTESLVAKLPVELDARRSYTEGVGKMECILKFVIYLKVDDSIQKWTQYVFMILCVRLRLPRLMLVSPRRPGVAASALKSVSDAADDRRLPPTSRALLKQGEQKDGQCQHGNGVDKRSSCSITFPYG